MGFVVVEGPVQLTNCIPASELLCVPVQLDVAHWGYFYLLQGELETHSLELLKLYIIYSHQYSHLVQIQIQLNIFIMSNPKPKPTLQPSKLKQQYNNLPQLQDQWSVIENLNKLYKIDRILLKHAYNNYPDKTTLQASKEYKNIQKFYRHTFDNLFNIQRSYLNGQVVLAEGEIENNYRINRNSTSKFIRDQHQHYHEIFRKYATLMNEQELGLNGEKIWQFVKDCFRTQYTQVLMNGQDYFKDDSKKQLFEHIVKMYCISVKDVDEEAYMLGNVWLGEQEILDFLSFWLKSNEDNQLYVLYCRTEEKLKKDILYLKAQAHKNKKMEEKGEEMKKVVHPVKLEEEEIENIQEQILKEVEKEQELAVNQLPQQKKKQEKVYNILEKFKKDREGNAQQIKEQKKQPTKPLSKKQVFLTKIPQLFTFGCKRRYPLSKGTTFDQIESEGKTMNLEKFINFCNYFGINGLLSRQLLSQIFKLNALNRLVIDEKRFIKIIGTIIETDQKTIDLFLNKKSVNTKLRSEAKLSNYKFVVRPVNGKSIDNMEVQLEEKKIVKSKSKQEKLNLYFLKKVKEKNRGQVVKKDKTILSSRVLPEYTNLLDLQNIRDDKFDPQKFFGNDEDQLLKMYESKFQSKATTQYQSPLDSILSKRLERGNKVLQKINSSSLKGYE